MATISPVKLKTGKKYRARVRVAGAPALSKNFDKKADAKNWAATQESKVRNNQIMPELEAAKHTLAELAEKYKERLAVVAPNQLDYKPSHLKPFLEHCGHLTLAELRKSHINEVMMILSTEPTARGKQRKQSTVGCYFQTLHHMLNYAVDDLEWMPNNPAEKVTRPPESEPKERFLSYDELAKVLPAAKKHGRKFASLIVILVSTGMRISEALKFKPGDVVDDCTAILARKTKNKKTRRVAVYGPAQDELRFWLKRTPAKKSIFGGDTKKNYQAQRRKWNKLVKDLKLEKITLHGLRHTLGSYLAMSGSQLLEISKILGHSSTKMAERYSHLMDEFTKDKVKKISNDVITQATDVSRETLQPGEKKDV